MVIWIIGLSGSGKSFLGNMLYKKLKEQHKNLCFIDGDEFRNILENDLGHNVTDREKNGWRVAKISNWLDSQKINVIASILSNFPEQQEYNRKNNKKYYQIYVSVPIDILIQRDSKGIYSTRKDVVGLNLPFHEPINSDHIFYNNYHEEKAQEFVDALYEEIKRKLNSN